MMRLTAQRATAIAAATVLLAACGDSTSPAEESPSVTEPQQPAESSSDEADSSDGPDTNISAALDALEAATDAVGDGQAYDMEQDTHDGEAVWEIKVASNGDEHKVYISSDGSSVVSQERKDSPDDDVDKVDQADIDASTALRTAADEVDGDLDELEIDTNDSDTIVWEVEFDTVDGTEVELEIDATSGEILG